ncbi:ABC transporter ATP-binding protein [Vibrio sp. JPW-9-11-11]|uniref:ABC transporter ATP-binding protein n=1 Tax=Vibrio sp. JPW-9-11-11 TaxID=1416532 RepID=UPI001593511D|nr:ABC transporter ATP-binding protein [Vibrio sp. JPW-9-11-11]NVD08486.1 ABC transporter ATP-binding protein [Vibrio sp. JPW-9-11-11]
MARATGLKDSLPKLRRFFYHVRPYIIEKRALIAAAFVGLFIQMLLRLLEPWPLKYIIDRLMTPDPSSAKHLDILRNLEISHYFAALALALVAITLLRALATYTTTICMALVGNHVIIRLRAQLFDHLQRLSPVFYQKQRSGDLVVRLISDMGMMKEVAVTAAVPLLGNSLIFICIVSVMLWLNWQLALLSLSTLPLLWLFTLSSSKQIHTVARKNRQREGVMAATASESIHAIKSVQALTLEGRFSSIFGSANNKSLKEGVKSKRLIAGLQRNVDILIAVSSAIVLWFGSLQVMEGKLTAGELVVFIYYLRRVFRPIRDFSKYTARLAKASAAGDRVLDVLNQEQDVRDQPDAIDAPSFVGNIAFESVSFSYLGDAKHHLNNLTLKLNAGEKVAIVGPSGSGKSTMVNLLLRLHDPQQGRITIDDVDIRTYRLASLRNQIAVVLQETALFATSIAENITIGQQGYSMQQIIQAAKLAEIHEFVASLPQGYDTEVGERGVTLSAGQRQRIAIARAALKQAPILILDEPTTGLDPVTEASVSRALYRLSEGHTAIIITHRKEIAKQCDHIVYMDKGQLSEQGTHQTLLEKAGEYRSQFGALAGANNDQ